jgi:hypothetical protein
MAALALIRIVRLPGKNLDLYFHDRYVPVPKNLLVTSVILALVLPLIALTVRYVRSTH